MLLGWALLFSELSYEQAHAKAAKEQKPLMVVVTAKWCGPCQVLKRDTLKPMADDLKSVVLVIVDLDERPDIAKAAMVGDTLPQISLYHCGKRFNLKGLQDKFRILELLKRAK